MVSLRGCPGTPSATPHRPLNIDLVRRTPLFAAAGEAMARVLRASFTQQLPRGAVMFEQHEMPDFLHLLLAGSGSA